MTSSENGIHLTDFGQSLDGQLVTRDDEQFDVRRKVFNGMIDKRPLAIALCQNKSDISSCLTFARNAGIPVSIRGGGHNIAGSAIVNDGLVIDLSALRGVEVDPERRIARAQPGARLFDFDAATQQHGLTTPTGIMSDTGLAGLTLGGGLGWLMAKFGLTCDNLVAADAILPDGTSIRAGTEPGEDDDLLWALRGGGGNFVIVTGFEYRLHPLTHVTAGSIQYDLDDTTSAMVELDHLADHISDEVVLSPTLITNDSGQRVYNLDLCHCGDAQTAMDELATIRSIGRPLFDNIDRRPFVDWQQYLDNPARAGRRSYWKSVNIRRPSAEFLDYIVTEFQNVPSPHTMLTFDHIHGAATRVASGATAFGNRHEGYEFLLNTNWDSPDDDDANLAWTASVYDEVSSRYSSGAVYVNYLGDEGEDRVRQAYAGADIDRLRTLKRRFDPTNMLHTNQNILPSPMKG